MISGNGSTGIMVMGLPVDDLVIVNHAKCWTVSSEFRPEAPDLRKAWKTGRELARQGRYRDADSHVAVVRKIVNDKYGDKAMRGIRPWYDRTHPAFHMHIATESAGKNDRYRRETNFATGEVIVSWTDIRGDWVRRTFVSRTHDAIVMEFAAPVGAAVNASLRLTEAPGKMDNNIGAVTIDHGDAEMYLMWRMLRDFSKLPFVNTSFITCHNPGPHIYNLDTTFAMPAVLMEMLVFSEPGLVEVLPALPVEEFRRGTLRGVLARGGVVVEQLHWNLAQGLINVTIRSNRTQSVTLRSGVRVRCCHAENPAEQKLITRQADRNGWNIDLPARESISIRLNM